MPISHQNSYSVNSDSNISSVAVSSAAGRVLLYAINARTAAVALPTTVSYGAAAMSSFSSLVWIAADSALQVWYLLDPAVGTANITTDRTATPYHCAAASVLDGVDTTSFATAFGTPASATGNSASPSVNVASGAGKLVFGAVASYVNTVTVSSPSVERASATDGDNPELLKILTNAAGNNPETIAGTMTSQLWGIWGVALNESGFTPPGSEVENDRAISRSRRSFVMMFQPGIPR